MSGALSRLRRSAETTFWRHTAGLAGFAVRHRRLARTLPMILLAGAAFLLGRLAGQTLLVSP